MDDIVQKDHVTIECEFKEEDGSPTDLTDCKLIFVVKESLDIADASATIKKEVTSHTNATEGITQVVLDGDNDQGGTDHTPGHYIYAFKLIDSDGNNSTLGSGEVDIVQAPVTTTS